MNHMGKQDRRCGACYNKNGCIVMGEQFDLISEEPVQHEKSRNVIKNIYIYSYCLNKQIVSSLCYVLNLLSLTALLALTVTFALQVRHVTISESVCVSELHECLNQRTVCDVPWVQVGYTCLFFSDEEKNWTSARGECAEMGGQLGILGEEAVWKFVMRFKGGADHWCGLRRVNQRYMWVNNRTFVENKRIGLKIGGDEDCIYVSKEQLLASRCHIPIRFICTKIIN